MPISKQWPGGASNATPTTYSIPLNNELNWLQLSSFLQSLADSAQGTTFQKWKIRTITASPDTLIATADCVLAVNVAGAASINLPAGQEKQIFLILDASGAASTNNITITPNGAETIRGLASLVLNKNYQGVILAFSGTNWNVFGPFVSPGTVTDADFVGQLSTAHGGTGVNSTATFPSSGTVAVVPSAGVVKSNGTVLSTSNVNLATEVSGILPNANTTATAVNTGSMIVARDSSGNFAAGTIIASLSGNASTATTAVNVSGTVAIANGGTGQTTQQAALNAISGATTANRVLRGNGTNVTLSQVDLSTDTTGTLAIANGGTGQTTANNALNALLPSQGSSANKYLKTDGTNTSWAAASGGAGEINAILNSSGADGTTGWTGTTVVSGSNSPLNPITATAFSIANSATTESSTSGGYYPFTMPSALQNRKLKVEFFFTTPATDVYRVSVYKSTTRVPLSTDSSSVTTLPASVTGGKFTAYFDSDNSTNWTVSLTRTSGTTGPCYITNVIVGPGIQPQGAVVGAPISWTPTGSWTSNVTYTGDYQRIGTTGRFHVKIALSGAPNAATLTVNMPSGLTIDSSLVNTALGVNVFGQAQANANGTPMTFQVVSSGSTSSVQPYFQTTASGTSSAQSGVSNTVPISWTTPSTIDLYWTVPVSEWAASGVVQLAQNDVEFSSNSGSAGTSASQTYSTGMVYGPSGSNIVAVNSTTGGYSVTKYLVKWATPQQTGDQIIVEVQESGEVGWKPVNTSKYQPVILAGGRRFGIELESSADPYSCYVSFGNSGAYTSSTIYDANGAPWSGETGTKFRVRKSSAGASVGFGIVVPGTSSGLVSASGLPGNTTGNAIATGYVGEFFGSEATGTNGSGYRTSTTTAATTTTAALISLSLNKGAYLVGGNILQLKAANTNNDKVYGNLRIGGTAVSPNNYLQSNITNISGGSMTLHFTMPIRITADSVTVDVYMNTLTNNADQGFNFMYAIRIA